jgi:hypothetical protein
MTFTLPQRGRCAKGLSGNEERGPLVDRRIGLGSNSHFDSINSPVGLGAAFN